MKQEPTNKSKDRIIPRSPYRHVLVSTTLSLEEAVKLFRDSVSTLYVPPIQFLPPMPPPNTKKLEGDVVKGGFSLRTNSNTNGLIAPAMAYLSGQFIETQTGVKIDMHASPGSTMFLVVVLGFLVTLGSGIFMALRSGSGYSLFLGGFAAILIVCIGYIAEVDTLDQYIMEILQGHLLKDQN